MKKNTRGSASFCGVRQNCAKKKLLTRSAYIAQSGMIAAVYAACTLFVIFALQGLAWGPVQFRVSEALCVLALFTPAAVPGLTAGCALANLIAMAFNGKGALGLLDVFFGSAATLVGALICRRFAEKPAIALMGPVVANALIVPAYLPIILQGLGFYTIPFTTITLDGVYLAMYLFGVVSVGIGEAVVVYLLGYPLSRCLARFIPTYAKIEETAKIK